MAEVVDSLDKNTIMAGAQAREKIMGTALDFGLAIPHARVAGLEQPIITFGYSQIGIDWDARDGLPTHFVFLILVSAEDPAAQVQILSALAKVVLQPEIRDRLAHAQDARDAHHTLSAELRKQAMSGD